MAGPTKLRYRDVRVADKTDDQKTAVQILNALVSSITQEDLQEFVLSQIKRIIHGNNAGTWRDDFESEGILSLAELSFGGAHQSLANCLSTDNVGDVVRVSGDAVGGVIQVTRADISDHLKMPGIGLLLSKSSPTDCMILRYGLFSVTAFTPGKIYFVGSDGRPTAVRPVAPLGGGVFVQTVGVALTSTQFLVNPSFNMTRVIP
jgi:hypothetical protein